MRNKKHMLDCAEFRFNYAMRFPAGSSKYEDYVALSWFWMLAWAGADVWGDS